MAIQTLKRVFRTGSTELRDPDPSMSPDEVRQHWAANYPHLATATVSEPELKGDTYVYKFEAPQAKTKGSEVQTLPGKLAAEISRVTALREAYKRFDGSPGVNIKPALVMMDASLKLAVEAAGQPDVEAQIRAVHDLQSFTG